MKELTEIKYTGKTNKAGHREAMQIGKGTPGDGYQYKDGHRICWVPKDATPETLADYGLTELPSKGTLSIDGNEVNFELKAYNGKYFITSPTASGYRWWRPEFLRGMIEKYSK